MMPGHLINTPPASGVELRSPAPKAQVCNDEVDDPEFAKLLECLKIKLHSFYLMYSFSH